MNYKLIKFKVFADTRGKLVPLEAERDIPFKVNRVYYIFDTLPDEIRGKHAHKKLQQIIIAIDGSCSIVLDNGKKRKKIRLNRPDEGLYIGEGIWREMHEFSYGCKLLVLASEYYDPDEYMRDYNEYIKEVNR
jgi:dTDP-4-dehydrorhamnose 3,5-epimerase-like enzyme